jgi:hypothetical protein
MSEGSEEQPIGLEDLPPDELARIMIFLRLDDVECLRASSRTLKENLDDDRVWYNMCHKSWGRCTDTRQWCHPGADQSPSGGRTPAPPPPRHIVRAPSCFRELYYYLRHVERLCGLWRVIGEGPNGALIRFSWGDDALSGSDLSFPSLRRRPHARPFLRICPRRGLDVEVEWGDDDSTVTMKVHPSGGLERLHRTPSAEAAAAVSYGRSPQSATLGTSPEGSFEHAWLEFMAGSVQRPARVRRRRSAVGAVVPGPTLHHLRRVDPPPRPTVRHPLSGLWAGDYGPAGVQVVRLAYDFSGRAARLIADKVTGDEGVAAGQRTWWALAAPLPQPLEPGEEALAAELRRAAEDAAADGALEALFLEDTSSDDGSDAGGGAGGSRPAPAPPEAERQVVAVHMGAGQVGVGEGQAREWVEGRLWVYADGGLRFWWLEDVQTGVELRRCDAELAAPCLCTTDRDDR